MRWLLWFALADWLQRIAALQARAIQFFTPGMPMVYYNGLLAQLNDFKVGSLLPKYWWSTNDTRPDPCNRILCVTFWQILFKAQAHWWTNANEVLAKTTHFCPIQQIELNTLLCILFVLQQSGWANKRIGTAARRNGQWSGHQQALLHGRWSQGCSWQASRESLARPLSIP